MMVYHLYICCILCVYLFIYILNIDDIMYTNLNQYILKENFIVRKNIKICLEKDALF
jgi:hypothetical protein